MKLFFTGLRAIVYGIAFVALWVWIALSLRVYDRYFSAVLPGWIGTVGIILIFAGGTLVLLCLSSFIFRGNGTPAVFDPPRKFVAVGPYRYVRNPMYIGGWIMFIGFGCYQRSITILLFSLIWLMLAHTFVIFIEERGLEKRFGDSYREYKRSVNRWLPIWQ